VAARGRRPKPIAGRQLARERPQKPSYLDDEASAEWDRLVELLDASGVLSRSDGAALAIYCEAFSRGRKAAEQLAAEQEVLVGKKGSYINPWLNVKTASEKTCFRILRDFGLTPATRKNVKPLPSSDNPLAKFLAG
jgi:P27 family predicted phage terminase small subunit